MHIILALIIGVCVGIVMGAFGAGGGIIGVPVLVYLLSQSPHQASAESLVIVFVTALAGLTSRLKYKTIRWRDGLTFGLLCIVGSIIGSRLNAVVHGDSLLIAFSVLLLCVAVLMAMKALGKGFMAPKPDQSGLAGKKRILALTVAATVTGLISGFFGVSGGFAVVPILVLLMHFGMREATATSLVVTSILALSGLLSRIGTGIHIEWGITLAFAVSSMVGGFAGGPLTKNVSDRLLTGLFALLLVVIAVGTLVAN